MRRDDIIIILDGASGVGPFLETLLKTHGFTQVFFPRQIDLTDGEFVKAFFQETRPSFIFFAGDQSGGIRANQNFPATLMRRNLTAQIHVFENARSVGVKKLLFLASSCVYPRQTSQPMQPEQIMTAPLEPTSSAYATAKLAGIEQVQSYRNEFGVNFISAIPADMFGHEETDPENAHVVAAMLKKMIQAKLKNERKIVFWGTGKPVRDFIYAEDLADACRFIMENYEGAVPINLSAGCPVTIADLANQLKTITGFDGEILFDAGCADGTPKKILDTTALFQLGWKPKYHFLTALQQTYQTHFHDSESDAVFRTSLAND